MSEDKTAKVLVLDNNSNIVVDDLEVEIPSKMRTSSLLSIGMLYKDTLDYGGFNGHNTSLKLINIAVKDFCFQIIGSYETIVILTTEGKLLRIRPDFGFPIPIQLEGFFTHIYSSGRELSAITNDNKLYVITTLGEILNNVTINISHIDGIHTVDCSGHSYDFHVIVVWNEYSIYRFSVMDNKISEAGVIGVEDFHVSRCFHLHSEIMCIDTDSNMWIYDDKKEQWTKHMEKCLGITSLPGDNGDINYLVVGENHITHVIPENACLTSPNTRVEHHARVLDLSTLIFNN